MQRALIAKGNDFHLISVGNGWAYEFGRNGAERVLWFQDDDATQFREEWEALESTKPYAHTSALLAEIWERYT